MKIKIITTEQQLDDLKDAWLRLQSQGGARDISVTWEWMRTWWEVFKEGRTLAVVVASDSGEIIGVAPLIQRDVMYYGLIPMKRLEFMASGEEESDEICSDYLDFLARPGEERAFVGAVFEYLNTSSHVHWNEMVLCQMNSDSPVLSSLPEFANKYNLKIEEFSRVPCAYTQLPASLDEYIGELGRRTRKQIRRDINRLNELGKVEYKVAKTEEEVERTKNVMIALHQARWKRDGKAGVFSSDKFKAFHDSMIITAHKNDWLRLGTLLLDEKPLACEYNFKYKERIYSYQSGVNIFEDWNLSIGTLADVYAIGDAISDGTKEYDFLAGGSDYKIRLAKNSREIVTIRVAKPSAKESVLNATKRIKKLTRRYLKSGRL